MKIKRKSRGRPRQKLPKIDKGTKELQYKRNAILGKSIAQNPALAESLLGILYSRQLISSNLYETGRFFGELGYRFEPCLGHNFRQRSSFLLYKRLDIHGISPHTWSDEEDKKRTHAWNKALAALKQSGNDSYKIVLAVVFYNQDIYTTFPPMVETSLKLLRNGLHMLELYFKGGLKVERDKPYDRESFEKSTMFPHPLKALQFESLP